MEYYYKTDFTGAFTYFDDSDWNPTCWKGTEEEYDKIWDKYLCKNENYFKVIGIHKYETLEDYIAIWGRANAVRRNK